MQLALTHKGADFDALSSIVEKRLGLPTRSVELSLPQRADPVFISKTDQDEAIACGAFAVKSALKGETAKMVIIKRLSNSPYKIELALAPVDQVANAEKKVPASMIAGKTHMDRSFREYLLPLIQGEVYPKFQDGIYMTAVLKKVKAR